MDIFKLYHQSKRDIPLIKGFPEEEIYQKYRMEGATEYYYAKIDKRNLMLFIHFDLDEIGFWRSRYLFRDNYTIHCYSKSECLEHHNLLRGETLFRVLGFDWRRLSSGKNNLIYLPEVYNEVRFRGEMDTFDIHFTKDYLYALGNEYPVLIPLIEEVKNGRASSLFNEFSNISPSAYYMMVLLMELLDMDGMPVLKAKDLGKQLIIDHIQSGHIQVKTKYTYGYTDVEYLRKISLMLERHMDQSGILTKVIKDSFLNGAKLTEGFKVLFNCTPRWFLFEHRINRAAELLLKNYTLKDICDLTGYSTPSHLENGFRRYYGISIHEYRLKYSKLP